MEQLDAFAIFAKVGELGSMSASARALGLPKVKVSRTIARLESIYNVKLVERTTRSVTLTEVGRLFHARCLRIREEAQEAHNEVAAYRGEPAGTLTIGCPSNVSRTLLSPYIHEFLDRYPRINVRVKVGERLLPEPNNLDVVLHGGWLLDSRLTMRKIAEVRMVLVASKEYVLARGLPMSPDSMDGHPVIANFFADGTGSVETGSLPAYVPTLKVFRGGEQFQLPVWDRFTTTDHLQMMDLVKRGHAIAAIPVVNVLDDLRSGRLVRVLPGYQIHNQPTLYALYTSRAAIVPKLRVFLEFIASAAERELQGQSLAEFEGPSS